LLDTIASYNETMHMDSRGTKCKLNKKKFSKIMSQAFGSHIQI